MNLGTVLVMASAGFTALAMLGYARDTFGIGPRIGLRATRLAVYLHAAGLFMTSLVLWKLILSHQFEYSYVFRYSSLDMPLKYLIASFWGGQEGTFLLWAFYGGVLAVVLRFKGRYHEAPLLFFYMSITFFLLLMLIKSSPFARLSSTPPDGNGLNPLLQDPWMTIHPPIMFFGFASLGVPAAYAMAAMVKRDWDRWVRQSLPWTLLGVLCLGLGLTLGGYWSYSILGWGGFWGWDPVENSSLVPWLVAVALLHNQLLQRARGSFRRFNLLLAVLPFLLLTYSTFLTRSGVLADFSVHSFTDLGINQFLAAFMIVFAGSAAVLYVLRVREIPRGTSVSAPGGRDTWMFWGSSLLTLFAAFVCLGTSAPLLSKLWGTSSNVQPQFYNRVGIPFVMAFGLLMAWAPHASWKGSGAKATWVRVRVYWILAALAGVLYYLFLSSVLYAVMMAIATGALLSNGALAWSLLKRRVPSAGGMVAHVGVALVVLGIVLSTTQDTSRVIELPRGESVEALGYHLQFTDVRPVEHGKKSAYDISVSRGDDSFILSPTMYYNDMMSGMMKKPAIQFNPTHDLYISPGDYSVEPPSHRAGSRLVLREGESQEAYGMAFRFEGFRSRTSGSGDQASMSVLADVTVARGGEEYVLSPEAAARAGQHGLAPGSPVVIPGTTYALTLDGVDATNGRIRLNVALPRVLLAEGETGTLGDYTVTFESFDVDMGRGRGGKVEVMARTSVERSGRVVEAVPGQVRRNGLPPEFKEVPLDQAGLNLVMTEVNAAAHTALFQLVTPPRESLWVEVSRKPFIVLLWMGTALLVAGAGLAAAGRFRGLRDLQETQLAGRLPGRRDAA